MLRIRVIPTLLIDNEKLVKTVKFSKPRYLGDPRNAVKIFNDKEVDEIAILDISSARRTQSPDFHLIEEIASECFIPMAYGGGIRSLEDIQKLIKIGVEKVILNSIAVENPDFVREAAQEFGSQSILVSIDFRKNFFGKYQVYSRNGKSKHAFDPVSFALHCVELGAGELILHNIDRDGTMEGFDQTILKTIAQSVSIPVIAAGGAKSIHEASQIALSCGLSGIAAGSLFVFHGKHRAVLISYPSPEELERIFPYQV